MSNVLQFNNTNKDSYKEFFKWVTASIKATSEKVNTENLDAINLSKSNSGTIEKIDINKEHHIPDEKFVVLNGRCSKTERAYLIKFKKSEEVMSIDNHQSSVYLLENAYRIDKESYKKYSAERDYSLKVASDSLIGNPSCPCCENQIGIATCICGGIHCISGIGEAICPWCGNIGSYAISSESYDINRGLG